MGMVVWNRLFRDRQLVCASLRTSPLGSTLAFELIILIHAGSHKNLVIAGLYELLHDEETFSEGGEEWMMAYYADGVECISDLGLFLLWPWRVQSLGGLMLIMFLMMIMAMILFVWMSLLQTIIGLLATLRYVRCCIVQARACNLDSRSRRLVLGRRTTRADTVAVSACRNFNSAFVVLVGASRLVVGSGFGVCILLCLPGRVG